MMKLDLNLLLVFEALMTEQQNVSWRRSTSTPAAGGQSPLARLRDWFADALRPHAAGSRRRRARARSGRNAELNRLRETSTSAAF